MLRALAVVLQMTLLLIVNVVALFVPRASHIDKLLSHDATGTHIFRWDGVIAMLVLYAVIVLIELVSGRKRWAGLTTLALILAILVSLYPIHLGFMTLTN